MAYGDDHAAGDRRRGDRVGGCERDRRFSVTTDRCVGSGREAGPRAGGRRLRRALRLRPRPYGELSPRDARFGGGYGR